MKRYIFLSMLYTLTPLTTLSCEKSNAQPITAFTPVKMPEKGALKALLLTHNPGLESFFENSSYFFKGIAGNNICPVDLFLEVDNKFNSYKKTLPPCMETVFSASKINSVSISLALLEHNPDAQNALKTSLRTHELA